MTLHATPNDDDNNKPVHPDALKGLMALRGAGLIRHSVDHPQQCSAWGSVVKFNPQGQVTGLDLGGCRLRKGLPDGVVTNIDSLSTIEILNLGGTDLPVAETLQLLLALPQLMEVHLGGNGVSDAGLKELAQEWLPQATKLQVLDLRYNDISGLGCEVLSQGIRSQQQSQPALAKLYLEGNRIQDSGAIELAKLLEENTSLLELFLGANSIGTSGAIALAGCLRQNKVITKLYLEGNSIGPEGAEAFTNALLECDGNTALKHLFVDNNGIGKEESKKLAQALNSGTAIGESLLDG